MTDGIQSAYVTLTITLTDNTSGALRYACLVFSPAL